MRAMSPTVAMWHGSGAAVASLPPSAPVAGAVADWVDALADELADGFGDGLCDALSVTGDEQPAIETTIAAASTQRAAVRPCDFGTSYMMVFHRMGDSRIPQ